MWDVLYKKEEDIQERVRSFSGVMELLTISTVTLMSSCHTLVPYN